MKLMNFACKNKEKMYIVNIVEGGVPHPHVNMCPSCTSLPQHTQYLKLSLIQRGNKSETECWERERYIETNSFRFPYILLYMYLLNESRTLVVWRYYCFCWYTESFVRNRLCHRMLYHKLKCYLLLAISVYIPLNFH